jgi:hypothetical protein
MTGFGTGFLVAPDIVLTTLHVAESFWRDQTLDRRAVCRFDYETRPDVASVGEGSQYRLHPSCPDAYRSHKLDFALLRLASPVGTERVPDGTDRGFLTGEDHVFAPGDPVMILQHSGAEPLKLAIGSVIGTAAAGRVTYKANTETGSSGAPCFTADLRVAAMHQEWVGESSVGILFGSIVKELRDHGLANLLG